MMGACQSAAAAATSVSVFVECCNCIEHADVQLRFDATPESTTGATCPNPTTIN
jgi:hypothetical protein